MGGRHRQTDCGERIASPSGPTGRSGDRTASDTELQQPTGCFAFDGHSDSDHLFAQNGMPEPPELLDAANTHLLADKIAYVVACDSASDLGQDAITPGATTYIGYDDILGIVWGGPEVWFRDGSNAAIPYFLAPPPSVATDCGTAVDLARGVDTSGVDYYARGGGVGHYALAAAWLRWNRDSLVLLGNPSSTL